LGAAYEAQRDGDTPPSTWEVITAMAWPPAAGTPRREGAMDVAAIPVSAIPRRPR
jgi:malonyl-CoA O-methyltransferase